MSIENDLGRIAVALEQMVKQLSKSLDTTPTALPIKTTKAAKVMAEPVLPVDPQREVGEPDMFSSDNGEDKPTVTLEKLSDLLKTHAKLLGTKTTISLIIKYGANPNTPKINTIPENNFAACYVEAESDLKKGKK